MQEDFVFSFSCAGTNSAAVLFFKFFIACAYCVIMLFMVFLRGWNVLSTIPLGLNSSKLVLHLASRWVRILPSLCFFHFRPYLDEAMKVPIMGFECPSFLLPIFFLYFLVTFFFEMEEVQSALQSHDFLKLIQCSRSQPRIKPPLVFSRYSLRRREILKYYFLFFTQFLSLLLLNSFSCFQFISVIGFCLYHNGVIMSPLLLFIVHFCFGPQNYPSMILLGVNLFLNRVAFNLAEQGFPGAV